MISMLIEGKFEIMYDNSVQNRDNECSKLPVQWSVCATALAFIKIETTFYQEISAFNAVYFIHRNKKLVLGLFFSFPTWLSSCDSFIVRKSSRQHDHCSTTQFDVTSSMHFL